MIIAPSVPLLLAAAAGVGIAHSVLPDHWVPLAVVARTNRWSLGHTAKVSFLASLGHVGVSLVLGAILAAAGLALRNSVVAAEGQIVGGVLVLTGLGFLIWALLTRGHGHTHSHGRDHGHSLLNPHDHSDAPVHDHGDDTGHHHHDDNTEHTHDDSHAEVHHHYHHEQEMDPSREDGHHHRHGSWLTEIAVPFGIAASPDLTILPVFLAASAVGVSAAIGTLVTFTLATLCTFVVLTVAATIGGYQVQWPWLEENGHVVSALVLLLVGVLVFANV